MIVVIRTEFEHNLTQQIYMSSGAWEMIKNAKEEMIKLVNLVAMKLPEDAPASELTRMVIEASSAIKVLPTTLAIEYIKKEIGQIF
jgi:trans-2-enoyl-CoA reductase